MIQGVNFDIFNIQGTMPFMTGALYLKYWVDANTVEEGQMLRSWIVVYVL